MSRTERRFYRLSRDLEDVVAGLLWAAGCQGLHELGDGVVREPFVETEDLTLAAYFAAGEEVTELELQVREMPGVSFLGAEVVEERDWLETYRRLTRPLAIGRCFLVDPREPDEPAADNPEGRVLLRLPARQAFGTGSHESTRLILELMEAVPLAGRRVLDVGTGSGILSFAALALGARFAAGFDLDLPSALQAGQNRGLNPGGPSFFAGRLEALGGEARFDAALVNVLPERILPQFPLLPPLLAADGDLLLSGMLAERLPEVLETVGAWGFTPRAEVREGEWVAWQLRR